ncbi:xanthine dehydrogenase family protein molybdopterin-binding subunit [Mangrovibrevibacter kandeliae]|uniref:xanthine dehydrogenase family protein molybdopterin-binding subunit n=1 Tax=Mangrovibrevibacter kandeliae TaxID=2968473 RepID=UPI002118C177|nr:xanthine dehydrogenase family protein molybdopterin-binding subunit [Aurantimonas sp. CSK15Z-1]MCQ8780578.1 xanthine dehydrogenase family protein molybdopterin-binding subunit [Aurantimonas sp. CSK15Z-1]
MTPLDMPMKHGDAGDGASIGQRLSRHDGKLKITGSADYALERQFEHAAYAVLVPATIGAGRVVSVDTAAALAAGAILVLTPEDDLGLAQATTFTGQRPEGAFLPLPHEIRFDGQSVALVVAESLEAATEAARRIKVTYEAAPVTASLVQTPEDAGTVGEQFNVAWGDAQAAYADAPVKIEADYHTPREYHAAMEPHGLIAKWDGDRLTVWQPSQWVHAMARNYSDWFGIPMEDVRVVSPYVGGGFGSKGFNYGWEALVPAAARRLGRPVKLALSRPQNFNLYGGRASTRQTLKLGATKDGMLQSILLTGASETSTYGVWPEQVGAATPLMYGTPNYRGQQRIVQVNTVTPGALRGPGKAPSAFGIESAMDELAYAVGVDPLEIRLRNQPDHDRMSNKPWSTRRLREALTEGAAAFGWDKRPMAPRSMRDGHQLIGWGVATGTFPVIRNYGEAEIRVTAEGRVEVVSGATDIGQGTYTVLAQTAADAFGVPVDEVSVRLGDSSLPGSPVAGGSKLAGVMTGAVHKAATAAREELIGLALTHPDSPFHGIEANTLELKGGRLTPPRADAPNVTVAELLRAIGRDGLTVRRDTLPEDMQSPEERKRAWTTMTTAQGPTVGDYSQHSWCAHFAEVRVDEDFGTVRVSRIVSAFDCGLLYNPKLVESQWQGGIIMGIGMALFEEGLVDARNGRVVNNNLGDYLVPTNADVPEIQVISVGIPDTNASLLGGKGVGEVGIVGVAPAIANAVFHATGKRVRDLPITLEKLI